MEFGSDVDNERWFDQLSSRRLELRWQWQVRGHDDDLISAGARVVTTPSAQSPANDYGVGSDGRSGNVGHLMQNHTQNTTKSRPRWAYWTARRDVEKEHRPP